MTEPEDDGSERSREAVDAKNNFADDDRCEPDDDGADAHAYVSKAVVLCNDRAAETDEGIRNEKTDDDHGIGIYTLGAHHLCIIPGRADAHAKLGTEEPVNESTAEEKQHCRHEEGPRQSCSH